MSQFEKKYKDKAPLIYQQQSQCGPANPALIPTPEENIERARIADQQDAEAAGREEEPKIKPTAAPGEQTGNGPREREDVVKEEFKGQGQPFIDGIQKLTREEKDQRKADHEAEKAKKKAEKDAAKAERKANKPVEEDKPEEEINDVKEEPKAEEQPVEEKGAEDALHDERKEGLQEGIKLGAYQSEVPARRPSGQKSSKAPIGPKGWRL